MESDMLFLNMLTRLTDIECNAVRMSGRQFELYSESAKEKYLIEFDTNYMFKSAKVYEWSGYENIFDYKETIDSAEDFLNLF